MSDHYKAPPIAFGLSLVDSRQGSGSIISPRPKFPSPISLFNLHAAPFLKTSCSALLTWGCSFPNMAFAAINSSATKKIPAIEDAFAAEPSLKKRVYDAIGA